MAQLGFGGLLLTDSRGYWDDEDHVRNPSAAIRWGGDEWLDLQAHAIREASKHGLLYTVNVAASGGHLRGDVDVGDDSPKFLKCRHYRPGERFETPDIPHYRDIAVFAVRTDGPAVSGSWCDAGDGFFSMEGNVGKRLGGGDLAVRKAVEVKELGSAAEGAALGGDWTVVRIGAGTVPGHEMDIDVLDRTAVWRHLDRVFGRLIDRVPGLSGVGKTFVGLYNVSWEGLMPTWSATFEADFKRIAGYDLRPLLPALAGFELTPHPSSLIPHPSSLFRDFRHARGVMMRDHLYGAVRDWARRHGLFAYSESGGPWGKRRDPRTFGECDQLGFLGANDFPQGEFWPLSGHRSALEDGHANANGRFFSKGVVSAAHVYDRPFAAIEAFTHMHRHWSVDPAFLKPLGDQAFADGINLIVWHTYSASPLKRFGTPGLEYFAGSHINRNVTWHDELAPMVKYLARCQCLLQRGKPVTDVAVLVGDRAYAGWGQKDNGRYRNLVSDDLPVRVPRGFAYDAINDEALALNPQLPSRYRVTYDARKPGSQRGEVDVKGLLPDVETASDFTWCHRREDGTDLYFLAGEGKADVVFRAAAPTVEIWDAVNATRTAAQATRLADGRTKVALELPKGGSCFVVFGNETGGKSRLPPVVRQSLVLAGPWRVSFAYHKGIAAKPPAPVRLDRLVDFTTRDDLKHFSGAATYETTFEYRADRTAGPAGVSLSLGSVPSGLAHVYVNGKDCGTVWCEPWEADVSATVKDGTNTLAVRYVNNWCNRLIGDCRLPEGERVTRSVLRYWNVPRKGETPWNVRPTVYSGYSSFDPLQPSGLLGPVTLVRESF